ncbi:hypothetical protein BLNAU_15514 [Blattamonas nauphoetae]|uniref:Uncharacterized protein n=1 Tax=Blattamonas nauphoetae TaxID=2049346 RepID=A0ABQ9XDZ4_9EUKA|nr:hypothetical protein BLNAU_15514 [Blattamonas nauphoetae]
MLSSETSTRRTREARRGSVNRAQGYSAARLSWRWSWSRIRRKRTPSALLGSRTCPTSLRRSPPTWIPSTTPATLPTRSPQTASTTRRGPSTPPPPRGRGGCWTSIFRTTLRSGQTWIMRLLLGIFTG